MTARTPAALLSVALLGSTVRAGPDPAEIERARSLTWSEATRSEGIAALRRLADAEPGWPEPRLDLARVLSWKPATRAEAIALLRLLDAEPPGRADVAEELARVLSWAEETRPEAVARLRAVIARDPERDSARLLLAEVLAWDPTTRREAGDLYRQVLDRRPESTAARVGLARLLSWSGDLAASRDLYREALERTPGDPAARLGLAEVERWAGRSRVALRVLSTAAEDGLAGPEARLERARAYSDLGRPARALREYEAVLAEDPELEAAKRSADDARRLLRPSLEIGISGTTASGDPETSKLEGVTWPISYSWVAAGDVRLGLRVETASFRNDRGSTRRTTTAASLEAPLGDRMRLVANLDLLDFEEAGSEVAGGVALRLVPMDELEVALEVTRAALDDSRLTAVGETSNGVLYGPLWLTEPRLTLTVRPGRSWDLSFGAGAGALRGANVAANNRNVLAAGLGRSVRIGNAWLRTGYSASWLSYDRDLAGFPPGDLPGDGRAARGVGGYFSPLRFLNQMVHIDVAWVVTRCHLTAGAAAGIQRVEDTASLDFGARRSSSEAFFGVVWRVSGRLALRVDLSRQDVASAFDRTRAQARWIWSF